MKRVWGIFGTFAVLGIYFALTYGFYLIHPGLGWIVGALLVLANALSYTPEARAKKAARLAVQQGALSVNQARDIAKPDVRHRGIN